MIWTFVTGEPEWAGPADGADQGDVCEEAGDDEEDEQRHRPRPGPAGHCLESPSSYFLSRFSFATKKSSQRSTYCHLLNTDHYMFHSINRDNEHNFLQMLLKRYFEVKSTNIHLNWIPDLKMQSICLWNILPEVGRVLVEAYYRVAWASGWIGQEFSIMQPVLQNLFKPEVGTATVCYLPIEGPRKWNTISRGLKSL